MLDLPLHVSQDTPGITTLTPVGFFKYLEDGHIHQNTFDKRSIVDKGKTSNIAKVLATVQTLWLLVQCVSRWLSNLQLTLLEIYVIIQVLCTILLYTLWWAKPLDVNEPIKIFVPRHAFPSSADPDLGEGLRCNLSGYDLFESLGEQKHFTLPRSRQGKGPRRHVYLYHPPSRGGSQWLYLFMEGMLIFTIGALHAAAWNVHFPSNFKLWLWRRCSIAMCAFPWAIGAVLSRAEYGSELLAVLWKMQSTKIGFWDWGWRAIGLVHGICKRQAKNHGNRNPRALCQSLDLSAFYYVLCVLSLIYNSGGVPQPS